MLMAACTRRLFLAVTLIAPLATAAAEKPSVAIAREYTGSDCVAGILKVEDEFVAYAIAVPYQRDKPRLAALFPGTFDAQLSGNASQGWQITYTPNSDQPAVHLQLGRASATDAGDIAIGENTTGLCQFAKDSEYAKAARIFEKKLKPFRSGDRGTLAIRMKIEDR
jgi:hypothetical protein